jgi:AraC-like DNA-binding protein
VAKRRPLCLTLDFDWRGGRSNAPRIAPLPAATLHEVRKQLAEIAHQQRGPAARPPIQVSVLILSLLNSLLTGFVLPGQSLRDPRSPVTRKLRELLAATDTVSLPLATLARQAGYQQDYLNRLLKRHEGLTLGQMRARTILARAQRLLPRSNSVVEVADAMGFSDPNYFARWFRKHTGVSPNRWRRDASIR